MINVQDNKEKKGGGGLKIQEDESSDKKNEQQTKEIRERHNKKGDKWGTWGVGLEE